MSTSAGRKRRRPNNTGLDYPEIPGVPMDVIPGLVNASRSATKFFHRAKEIYSIDKNEQGPVPTTITTHSLVDSLMNRVEAATEEQARKEAKEHDERRQRMKDAAQAWLEQVQRFARTSRTTLTSEASSEMKSNEAEQREIIKMSVPYACFLYLWELQQEHNRVAVRRAALYLSGLLLQKSRDCRHHLEQDSNLSTWISSIVGDKGFQWKHPETAAQQLPLLQREAILLLEYLVGQGYAKLYPKIGVASQRLRQRCPNHLLLQVSTTDALSMSMSSMSDWRRLRDIALQHGAQEIRRVEQWIERSHACLEILVPRVGQEEAPSVPESTGGRDTEENDDDDEEDIDWEDGDDFEDGTGFMTAYSMEHLSAVERTLAAMESSGGLQGGGLEVDLGKSGDEDKETKAPDHIQTLAKFQKSVTVLARRHMPRISLWLEGLTHADNLVVKESCLVSLPSETAVLRSHIVERLSELKRTISSILSSATRLNLETVASEQGTNNVSNPVSSNPPVAPRLCDDTGRQSLAASIQQRQKPKRRQGRSNRIQIKYRSS
jgi:hypothetical protein